MIDTIRRDVDPIAAWLVMGAGAVGALASGMALRPRRVFDQFLWPHFVGPLQAEAYASECVVLAGDHFQRAGGDACTSALAAGRIVAEPGLTTIGAAGYAAAFGFLLMGGLMLLHRLDICRGRRFLFATVPFMFIGGAILALRAATGSLPGGPSDAIGYPVNLLLVDPLPIFFMVLGPIAVLVAGEALALWGLTTSYSRPAILAAAPLFGGAVGALSTIVPDGTAPSLVGALAVVALATVLAVVVWAVVARVTPAVVTGIGSVGLVVVWAYVFMGVTTVVAVDWSAAFGFPAARPATTLNRGITTLTELVLPEAVTAVTKSAWPYLLVQIAVALLVAANFEEDYLADAPMALMLLVAVVGVAVVSAVRTLFLLTFGI